MNLKKHIIMGAGLLALAACGDSWNQEAGSKLDEGGFGNPTMNNMLAQMCKGQAKGYIVPDPVVAMDPKSPPSDPRYMQGQVMCSGHLNGKYAQVIWTEYVQSGTFRSQVGGGLQEIQQAAGGS
jgi:hypothetical protein